MKDSWLLGCIMVKGMDMQQQKAWEMMMTICHSCLSRQHQRGCLLLKGKYWLLLYHPRSSCFSAQSVCFRVFQMPSLLGMYHLIFLPREKQLHSLWPSIPDSGEEQLDSGHCGQSASCLSMYPVPSDQRVNRKEGLPKEVGLLKRWASKEIPYNAFAGSLQHSCNQTAGLSIASEHSLAVCQLACPKCLELALCC